MRLLTLIFVLAFVALGVVFGALNPGLVGYDLGFGRVTAPSGAALIAALVAGWLLGGLTAWSGLRARRRRRRQAGPRDA